MKKRLLEKLMSAEHAVIWLNNRWWINKLYV